MAGDRLGKLLVVRDLDEFVHQLRGEGVPDPVAGLVAAVPEAMLQWIEWIADVSHPEESLCLGLVTSAFEFAPRPWDLERFMHGDDVDTAGITLEGNRRTFAGKSADLDADGPLLRLGASSVTLGGLLKSLRRL